MHDISETLLLMAAGRCLVIAGGWLDLVFMYSGWSLGFLKSKYVPFDRLSVTSRKSTIFRLVLIVIFRPRFVKNFVMSFFILSA